MALQHNTNLSQTNFTKYFRPALAHFARPRRGDSAIPVRQRFVATTLVKYEEWGIVSSVAVRLRLARCKNDVAAKESGKTWHIRLSATSLATEILWDSNPLLIKEE